MEHGRMVSKSGHYQFAEDGLHFQIPWAPRFKLKSTGFQLICVPTFHVEMSPGQNINNNKNHENWIIGCWRWCHNATRSSPPYYKPKPHTFWETVRTIVSKALSAFRPESRKSSTRCHFPLSTWLEKVPTSHPNLEVVAAFTTDIKPAVKLLAFCSWPFTRTLLLLSGIVQVSIKPKESLITYVARNNELEIRETMGKSTKPSELKAID